MGRAEALGMGRRERNAASIAAIAAGAGWLLTLLGPRWEAMAGGALCSHAGLFAGRCPACYAAVALILGGAALGVIDRSRTPARAAVRDPSRRP